LFSEAYNILFSLAHYYIHQFNRRTTVKGSLGKNTRHGSKIIKPKGLNVGIVLEHLLSKHKTLSSNPSTTATKTTRKPRKKEKKKKTTTTITTKKTKIMK
jgi:hypothetical protein